MNYLANILTLLSLACGFISIIFSLESQFTFASWAIILSVFFDGLDGQVARKNPIPSEFGKELDSLVDVVSFGVAPSLLGYIFIYHDFYFWATLALFIFLTCSIMRLAKYNITHQDKPTYCFSGLPTTVGGGMIASFILIFRKRIDVIFLPAVFLIMVLILAYLMVSRVPYFNLDGLKKLFGNKLKLVIVIFSLILTIAAVFKKVGIMLFAFFLIYLIFSPFMVKRINSD